MTLYQDKFEIFPSKTFCFEPNVGNFNALFYLTLLKQILIWTNRAIPTVYF